MRTKIKKGERPLIGARAMCEMLVGWTAGDGSGHDGHDPMNYFSPREEYLGADSHGIEPIFREMTDLEIAKYIE